MKKGFTLVEIMIVVAILAGLASIAIPNLLRARINANQANAQATLKTIAAACEMYATSNNGNYPTGYQQLMDAVPPYINVNYTSHLTRNIHGYYFDCQFINGGYICLGAAVTPNSTGTMWFNINTGSIMTSYNY